MNAASEVRRNRRMSDVFRDEQGKLSVARILLIPHLVQNWVWMNLLIFGVIAPADSDVLNLLIGSLDTTILIGLFAWAIGPRSFQYLFPQLGAVVQGAGSLIRDRLKGTDRHREDDER